MSAYDFKAEALKRLQQAGENLAHTLVNSHAADESALRILQGQISGLQMAEVLILEAYKRATGDL